MDLEVLGVCVLGSGKGRHLRKLRGTDVPRERQLRDWYDPESRRKLPCHL